MKALVTTHRHLQASTPLPPLIRNSEEVLQNGNMENGLWWAGQTQGLIHEVASCAEVVEAHHEGC